MIGDRLEARLRHDPEGDPHHVAGRVWTRVAAPVAAPVTRPVIARAAPLGALVAIAIVILTGVLLRIPNDTPGATPSPTPRPSTTPLPSSAADASAMVAAWLPRFGNVDRPAWSISMIGPTGNDLNLSGGTFSSDPPRDATGRIGEVGRVYIAAAIVRLDACAANPGLDSCNSVVNGTGFSLDSTVKSVYPKWTSDVANTTVRQLLDGTSGIVPLASSVDDLVAKVALNPADDWTRDTRLGQALSTPRRFAPGDRRDPVDTEWVLLDEILGNATQRPVVDAIPGDVFPPLTTRFAGQVPERLVLGSKFTGEVVTDLDPAVIDLLGNAGAITASSHDLAEYAVTAWGSTTVFDVSMVDAMTDASNGRANPLGGIALCCTDLPAIDIGAVGHAAGWTAAMAYTFDSQMAIGVLIARDVRPDDIDALLHDLITLRAP